MYPDTQGREIEDLEMENMRRDSADDKVYTDTTRSLTNCPTFVERDGELERCNQPLTVTVYVTNIADKYGSWNTYQVGFPCGHTLSDMERSIKNEDYV